MRISIPILTTSAAWVRLACLLVVCLFITSLSHGQDLQGSTGPSSWVGDVSTAVAVEVEKSAPPSGETPIHRTVKYVGKYHLLALHFPIVFLLTAMLAQWHAVATGRVCTLVGPLLTFGAVAAVAAAALGWMYAYDSVYFGDDEEILFWHRWLGTGTAIGAVVVALIRTRLGPKLLGLALTACAIAVAAAAHFGGSLVYGADFLKKF